MKIGFCGLGKLGLPVACAMAHRGADVTGYDIDPKNMSKKPRKYVEALPNGRGDFNKHLAQSKIKFAPLEETVKGKDIVFIAVQTPHHRMYEGITPLPPTRSDFDYRYLKEATRAVLEHSKPGTVIAIISTVLPGTIRREIYPMAKKGVSIVYQPSFIAMGQTMHDFLHPEFVLMGGVNDWALNQLATFYNKILPTAPVHRMALESAEITKICYNTAISQKIAFANTVMEISDHFNADCDEVIDALACATKRVVSPAYMRGGMGDGGGCHPRDNIAMSWLAQQINLSHDIFSDAMKAREDQARRLADFVKGHAVASQLPMVIMGYAYKPECAITTGSAALLVHEFLDKKATLYDPYAEFWETSAVPVGKAVYLVGCRHNVFKDWDWPAGSIVIDPFRYIPDKEGVDVIRIGQNRKPVATVVDKSAVLPA